MKIAVIVAMESEFQLTSGILEKSINDGLYTYGLSDGHEILLMRSGIGKVNAASRLTTLLFMERPDLVINSGVAGGVGDGVQQGDVVIGTEYAYHDVWCGTGERGQVQGMPLKFKASEIMLKATEGLNVKRGLIVTGDQFIDNIEMVKRIREMYPDSMACDMESTAFAHVCHMHKIPFMAFRIISDTPGMTKDNTRQYENFFDDAPRQTFAVLKEIIKRLNR